MSSRMNSSTPPNLGRRAGALAICLVAAGFAAVGGNALAASGTTGPSAPEGAAAAPPADPVSDADAAAVVAYLDAGYDYDDAVALADVWELAEPYEAKVRGGQELLAGNPLPVAP